MTKTKIGGTKMENMLFGPVEVIGISLTLDAEITISSNEMRELLEKTKKETDVKIGSISINGKRITAKIFGERKNRENFLDTIAKKGFTIKKATSLT